MHPDDWARVTELFGEAMRLPAAERRAWLAAACPHGAIRAEVEAMLRAYETDPEYLEQPADAASLDGALDSLAGRRLGAYRLIREVGRGGMGVVYEARRDDQAFDRRAAVKVLPLWSAAAFADRFRFERQVLASLDHPGIAALVDAGTDDGVPYCVMEFVDGAPIDAWCRDHDLPLTDRVALVERVADAVACAHRHLIVHRDLKPSNILVTADGQPKLLDFGIATLLEAEGGASIGTTRTGFSSFTPEFASPEQIRGERVTTATDVYSLGVLLYLLVSGERPYEVAGRPPLEAMKTVCEVDPPPPSSVAPPALRPLVAGDLDTITMKALRKAPGERYRSVVELAADLRAWREHRPISAAPASMLYLGRRFVRRNRLMVSVAGAAFTALLVGGAVAVWQAGIARAERAQAEARFADVRALANAVVGPLYDEIAKVPGTTEARRLLVARALTYLDRLAALSADDIRLKQELADAYQKIGDVQGNHVGDNVGDVQGAKASFAKMRALREAVFRARGDAASRRAFADAELAVADIALGENRFDEAVAGYERALALVGQEPPASDEAAVIVAVRAHRRAAIAHAWAGRQALAVAGFDRALALVTPLATREHASPALRASLANTLSNSGDAFYYARDYGQALARFEAALAMERRRAATAGDHESRRDLTLALIRTAAAMKEVDRAADAQALEREALAMLDQMSAADSKNVALVFDRATTRQNLAITSLRLGDLGTARREATTALRLFDEAFAASPDSPQWRFDEAATWTTLGQIEMARRDFAAAVAAFRRAADMHRDPAVGSRMPSQRLDAYVGLGDALAALAQRTRNPALGAQARDAYGAAGREVDQLPAGSVPAGYERAAIDRRLSALGDPR